MTYPQPTTRRTTRNARCQSYDVRTTLRALMETMPTLYRHDKQIHYATNRGVLKTIPAATIRRAFEFMEGPAHD